MSDCKELEQAIPAYVLGALDASERARFEKHLRDCPNLFEEIAAYQDVIETLPYAASQAEPPAHLKFRTLEAISRQSQRGTFTSTLMQVVRSPALASLLLIAAVGLGLWNFMLYQQLDQQSTAQFARQREFVAVMAYADSAPRKLTGTSAAPNAVGRMYASPHESVAALIINNLPPLAESQVFQLWLIDPEGKRTSGGTFVVDAQGRGWLFVRAPQTFDRYRGVGITIEPSGGSLQPTGTRVAAGDL